jgi:hypothetical protein
MNRTSSQTTVELPDFEERLCALLVAEHARLHPPTPQAQRRSGARRRRAALVVAGAAALSVAAIALGIGRDGPLGPSAGSSVGIGVASASEVSKRVVQSLAATDVVLHAVQVTHGADGRDYRSEMWFDEADPYAFRQLEWDGSSAAIDSSTRLSGDQLETITWDIAAGSATRTRIPDPSGTGEPGQSQSERLRSAFEGGKLELLGTPTLDGRKTYLLADPSEPSVARRIWVDAKTFLPVRMTAGPDASSYDMHYEWLPRTPVNLAALVTTPPADIPITTTAPADIPNTTAKEADSGKTP